MIGDPPDLHGPFPPDATNLGISNTSGQISTLSECFRARHILLGTTIGHGGTMILQLLPASSPREPSKGICGTCIHEGNCMFQRNSTAATTFCGEHEVEPARDFVDSRAELVREAPHVAGLCGTCDNFATCSLRSIEHIIHHCEHYC